jgi:NAD-dependent SIR2 family protein deacetylase
VEEIFHIQSLNVRTIYLYLASACRIADVHLIILQNNDTRPTFCKFIAEMATTAAMARPTSFHELLATLNARGRLLRVYTQNIDGLELKSGLSTFPGYGIYEEHAVCVNLHGNLNQLRCLSCGNTFSLDPYLDTLTAGELPECMACTTDRTTRARLQLRDRQTISSLRPDVIFYDEVHPLADEIAKIVEKDVRAVDGLLVVGSSMKVDGIQHIIHAFAQSLSRKHGKKKAPFFSSIYLNMDMARPQKWSEVFDIWVKGDCQLFATMVQKELDGKKTKIEGLKTRKHRSGKEEEDELSVTNVRRRVVLTDRRLDLRPVWRYY